MNIKKINLMIIINILFLFLCFSSTNTAQNLENQAIDLKDLDGSWHINFTNFPMWLKGDRTSPTLNYQSIYINNEPFVIDHVRFFKKGKTKSIEGINKVLNKKNTVFQWQGNGLMRVLKSTWRIEYFDKKNQWAIIYFEKTIFTPAGYDIISRNKKLENEQIELILRKLKELDLHQNSLSPL